MTMTKIGGILFAAGCAVLGSAMLIEITHIALIQTGFVPSGPPLAVSWVALAVAGWSLVVGGTVLLAGTFWGDL